MSCIQNSWECLWRYCSRIYAIGSFSWGLEELGAGVWKAMILNLIEG